MRSLTPLTPIARALLLRHTVRKPRFLATTGLALMLPAMAAYAQDVSFNIPAQPLTSALAEFGKQANVQVLYSPDLVNGQRSSAVQGVFSREQGIAQLLRGVPVSYSLQGTSLILTPAGDGSAVNLNALDINAAGLGETTEGTGSYTTGAAGILKGSNSLKDIPQSVSVLTRQRMDDQQIRTVDDALMQVTGISKEVTNSGNNALESRGFEIRNYQYDGVPMGYWAKGGTGIAPDMAMFDHVEVLRGAPGMLNGSGDPSGTVNLVRKRPTSDPHLSVIAQAGYWNDYRTQVDVSGPLDSEKRLRGRAVVAYESKDYYYDDSHTELPFFYGVMDYALSDNTVIAAGAHYQHYYSPRTWSGHLPSSKDGSNLDLSRSLSLAPDWAKEAGETYEAFADINHSFNDDWQGKVGVNYKETDRNTRYVYLSGNVDPATGTGASLYPYFTSDKMRNVALDANLTGRFTWLGLEHKVMVGANYLDEQYHGNEKIDFTQPYALNVYNVNLSNLAYPRAFALTPNNENTVNKGVYGSLNLQLAQPLHLIIGGRVSRYDYRSVYNRSTVTTAKETGQVTPYVGLLYDITPEWTAYASYTDIFNPQTGYYTPSMGALEPLEGSNAEIGIKGELLNGRLNTSISVFRIIQKNLAVPLDENLYTCRDDLCYATGGKVESKGIDAEISGEILDGWQASVGYTFNRQTYLKDLDSDGNPTSNQGANYSNSTPKHLFKAWTSYQLHGPLERFTVGGGVTAQSSIGYTSSSGYRFSQGGYALANAFVRYKVDQHWSVSLNGNNLLDRYYYEDGGGKYYGTPRNFTVTLRGDF